MNRFFAALVLTMLLLTAPALAHELLLKPSEMTAAGGETLPVELQSVHRFIVAEEVENIPRVKAGVFRNGVLKEAELRPNEPELRIDFDVKIEDDGAVLIVAAKDGEPWSVTNEGGMEGTRRELEARGLKVLRTTKNDKFAKAVVNAAKDDKNFASSVGQELEVVPMTNPADAVPGEFFDVKILLGGQPAALPVWATYDGFVTELDETYAYYTLSNAEGVARIKITAPGFWLVRTAKDGEPGAEGEYDSRSLRSILTFEVK
ncbi:MAG: DUF4198 domain-containing protein [Synergistaceae bacterium]|nr:DUF4198 domain-containing protein [Synergistaceae bacterium]